jgi:CRISPR-associated protein Cmr2
MSQYFHFTIGPVQGFVAQARRTRDYWGGSFLLSWLSGIAMASIRAQDGEIIFPKPPEDYLAWITGHGTGDPPRQGGIPNRFKAYQARVPAEFDAAVIVSDVQEAWRALSELVWRKDLAKHADAGTRNIWDRQIKHFWEISWVLTDDPDAHDLMDRRKNWRSHMPPEEPGLKCKMMAGYQELSGATRPGDRRVITFWKNVSNRIGLDLREKEQLCAMAFVKRRFARYFEQLEATLPSGLRIKGWPVPKRVPSVSYLAATHWLDALVTSEKVEPEDFDRWVATFEAEHIDKSEEPGKVLCLSEAIKLRPEAAHVLRYDATCYFEINPQEHSAARKFLRQLAKNADIPAAPSPFYAILLMDGDSLGKLLGELEPETVSAALNTFTQEAPRIVSRHNGFLVYAGGDDVLALFPLEDALPCAVNLREAYLGAFTEAGVDTRQHGIGISAAVAFAHVKIPMRRLLQDTHHLLDAVAKDQTGRDALAVRVWKPGGLIAEWSQPWEWALEDNTLFIENIAGTFRRQKENDPNFTNKFFFKIRERFALFNQRDPRQENTLETFDESEEVALLVADFMNAADNRKHRNGSLRKLAEAEVQRLVRQCRPMKRVSSNDAFDIKPAGSIREDGAMLIRFLATKGREER